MLPMYSILTFKTIMMLMTIWISTSGDVFIVFIAIIYLFGGRLSADQNSAVPVEYFFFFFPVSCMWTFFPCLKWSRLCWPLFC